MSCSNCKDGEFLIEKDVDNNNILQWSIGSELTVEMLNNTEQKLIIHIDRGYLRISDPEDNQCLDHGEKIKINYCPICGDNIKEYT